jgi:putative transcriptional regulator
MTPTHHLSADTLMAFSAGTLAAPIAAVVACHLDYCAACRARLREMDMIGALLLEKVNGAPISVRTLATARYKAETVVPETPVLATARRPFATASNGMPPALKRYTGLDLDDVPWKWLAPGIQHHRIALPEVSTGDLRLLKIKPGKKLPEHGHGGMELTLILKGAYTDCVGRFRAGDVADLDEEIEHQPIADETEGCICLAATERPARYKGPIARLLQPFVGM